MVDISNVLLGSEDQSARLKGRTATQRSKKVSEKGSGKGSGEGFSEAFWEGGPFFYRRALPQRVLFGG